MAMVASHNESTVWIANHCSPDLETFVERMNRRAQELGMTKTSYSNTSGLPASSMEFDNSASPHDLLLLALEVLKHPKLMEITGIAYTSISNGKGTTQYHNHNGLVINYNQEVDGIKTGYTRNARFCLVATARRGEHRLISIVLGVRSPWVRNGIVASMMNTYFDALKLGRLGDAAPDMSEAYAYMDSVNSGLAFIRPSGEMKHSKNSSEEQYAYTYKTVVTKIKKPLTVHRGDNLGKIANRYDVAVNDIKKWNRLNSSKVHEGQRLYVYSTIKKRVQVKLVVDPDEPYADNQPSQDEEDCGPATQTDQSIHQSVTVKNTIDSNAEVVADHKNVEVLKKAHKTVEAVDDTQEVAKEKFIYHVVQPGDTLWNIAQRYQASMDQIKKVNRIGKGSVLRSGTRIKIPVNRG
jgi:D-alanyl-D-alanine carboxypeptidase